MPRNTPFHGRVNLRLGEPAISFGDEASKAAYITQCEEAAASQTVPYAVAPGQRVLVQRGGQATMLQPGDEVRLEDLWGGDVPARIRLERLISRWVVLARTGGDDAAA